MFRRNKVSTDELAAVYAEGYDLPAELGLEPAVENRPSHRLTDLKPGAIAFVFNSGPEAVEAARMAIASSLPEGHSADEVLTALTKVIATFESRDGNTPGGYYEI